MAFVQKQFEAFGEAIKTRRYHENAKLAEKRERVLKTLSEGIARQRKEGKTIPSYKEFNQGSYDMGVGTKPLDGDYDIDVGLKFDLSKDDYDPVDVKTWVFEAVKGHTQRVELRRNCVTVFYVAGGEPAYHVDLAVYAQRDKNQERMYLARGKAGSTAEHRTWTASDPEGLTDKVNKRFDGDQGRQFRRVIRALKRWKDVKFPKGGNAAPRGIAITISAYEWFSPTTTFLEGKEKPDDLQAMRNLVGAILRHFAPRLRVMCPADPQDDLLAKMTDLHMGELKAKLEGLFEAIRAAETETDPHVACKHLAKEFGADFPIPPPEESGKPKGRSVTGSGNSG